VARKVRIALQISRRTESESGYVWTGKFDFNTLRVDEKILNLQRKVCGFQKITGAIESIDGRKRFKNRRHGGVALNAICYPTEQSTDLKLNRNGLINPSFGVLVVDTG